MSELDNLKKRIQELEQELVNVRANLREYSLENLTLHAYISDMSVMWPTLKYEAGQWRRQPQCMPYITATTADGPTLTTKFNCMLSMDPTGRDIEDELWA
jgi:hypothetical protein